MTDEKPTPEPQAIAPPSEVMIAQTAILYKKYALQAKELVGLMPVTPENRVRALCAVVHTMMIYDALAAQIPGPKPVVEPVDDEARRRFREEPIL